MTMPDESAGSPGGTRTVPLVVSLVSAMVFALLGSPTLTDWLGDMDFVSKLYVDLAVLVLMLVAALFTVIPLLFVILTPLRKRLRNPSSQGSSASGVAIGGERSEGRSPPPPPRE